MLSPFVYYSSFAHATYCCTHNISYVQSVDMIFAFDYLNDRERVTSKLSCHLRISKSLIALLFRCLMNVSSRTRLKAGFRYFVRHLPPLEAQSSRHVFIETLQSKDFSENLAICVNFQITASRFHLPIEAKIIIKFY